MSSGTLDVVVDPEQEKGVASVRVTVRYFREDVRDVAKACLVERGEGVSGVGVFVGVLCFPEDHSCYLPFFFYGYRPPSGGTLALGSTSNYTWR